MGETKSSFCRVMGMELGVLQILQVGGVSSRAACHVVMEHLNVAK